MSGADRARKHKEKMNKEGFVQYAVWIPRGALPEFKRAAELIRLDPELRLARLVDMRTGRLRGLG